MKVKCHPERKRYGRGWCHSCYGRVYREEAAKGQKGITVAEHRAMNPRNPGWYSLHCNHLRRTHSARGMCVSCYGAWFRRRTVEKRRTPEQIKERLAQHIERRENRPSKLYIPYDPPSMPVKGWDLGWLAAGNGVEIGLPKRKRKRTRDDMIPGTRKHTRRKPHRGGWPKGVPRVDGKMLRAEVVEEPEEG